MRDLRHRTLVDALDTRWTVNLMGNSTLELNRCLTETDLLCEEFLGIWTMMADGRQERFDFCVGLSDDINLSGCFAREIEKRLQTCLMRRGI